MERAFVPQGAPQRQRTAKSLLTYTEKGIKVQARHLQAHIVGSKHRPDLDTSVALSPGGRHPGFDVVPVIKLMQRPQVAEPVVFCLQRGRL